MKNMECHSGVRKDAVLPCVMWMDAKWGTSGRNCGCSEFQSREELDKDAEVDRALEVAAHG